MKKHILKTVSAIMVLSLLVVTFILPVSAILAVGSNATFTMRLEKLENVTDAEGKNSTTLGNVYKMTVNSNTNVPLNFIQLGITYDSQKFTPCWGTPMDGIFFDYAADAAAGMADLATTPLGVYADGNAYDIDGNITTLAPKTKFFGPLNPKAKATTVFLHSDPASEQWGTGVTQAGYDKTAVAGKIGLLYTKVACNNAITQGTIMPYGDQDIYSVYFRANGPVEGSEFRFTLISVSVGGLASFVIPGKFPGGCWVPQTSDAQSIETRTQNGASYTVPAPVVTGPAVASHKSEIRFNGVKPTPTSFDYRITSKILQADWDKYFAGTKTGAATNAITKVGAVAFDPAKGGAFDLAQAKTVAKAGASSGSYGYGSTTYIQKTATDAFFGCIIPGLTHTANNQDMQVLGFVEYKDATGAIQYIFYDAAATAAVNSKYDTALALWSK